MRNHMLIINYLYIVDFCRCVFWRIECKWFSIQFSIENYSNWHLLPHLKPYSRYNYLSKITRTDGFVIPNELWRGGIASWLAKGDYWFFARRNVISQSLCSFEMTAFVIPNAHEESHSDFQLLMYFLALLLGLMWFLSHSVPSTEIILSLPCLPVPPSEVSYEDRQSRCFCRPFDCAQGDKNSDFDLFHEHWYNSVESKKILFRSVYSWYMLSMLWWDMNKVKRLYPLISFKPLFKAEFNHCIFNKSIKIGCQFEWFSIENCIENNYWTYNPILDTNFTHFAFIKFTRIDKFYR